MNRIKLIGIDLDGTLLDNKKRISEQNIRAVRECEKRGIRIVPVTGRPYSGLYDEYKKAIGCLYSINTNGAAVMNTKTNERLISHGIARNKALEIMEVLKSFGCYYGIFHEGYGYLKKEKYEYELKKYKGTPLHRYIMTSRRTLDDPFDFIRSIDFCDNIYVMAESFDEREKIRESIERIRDIFFTCSADDDVEIGGNCSKGSSLLELGEKLGIKKDEIMAIGDSGNDLNMLQAAGFSVAMGNASDEIKSAADFVTKTCEENGVAYAINRLVLNNNGDRI